MLQYRRVFERLAGGRHFHLYRSSFALMGTTVSNAALGMLFWVAAARLLPADVVGAGAGGISALQLLSTAGWVGLHFTLMRYLPIAGTRRPQLVLAIYGVGVGSALIIAVVFLVLFAAPLRVGFLASSPLVAAVFLFGVAVSVISSLQDAVLLAIRKPLLVPLESLAFGVLKVALLIAFATARDAWTLLGSWIGATAVMVALVSIVLLRAVPDPSVSRLPARPVLLRFSLGHSAVGIAAWIPDFLVSLIVLAMLGGEANAHYFGAWTLAFAARLLVANMASALTVEAASGVDSFGRLARSAMRLAAWVLIPTVAILVVGAEAILRIFGPGYAEAATLLRLFALSIIPSAIVAYAVADDRHHGRFIRALVITASGTVVTLVLDVALIPLAGITGAGIGWLVGQTLAASIALAMMGTLRHAASAAPFLSRPNGDQ
jgi:O-antigen/teichoic acid export membrane protein